MKYLITFALLSNVFASNFEFNKSKMYEAAKERFNASVNKKYAPSSKPYFCQNFYKEEKNEESEFFYLSLTDSSFFIQSGEASTIEVPFTDFDTNGNPRVHYYLGDTLVIYYFRTNESSLLIKVANEYWRADILGDQMTKNDYPEWLFSRYPANATRGQQIIQCFEQTGFED